MHNDHDLSGLLKLKSNSKVIGLFCQYLFCKNRNLLSNTAYYSPYLSKKRIILNVYSTVINCTQVP